VSLVATLLMTKFFVVIGGNTDLSNALDRQIDSFNNFEIDSCMVGYYLMYDRTSTQT
jgi:hypothetical protein